MYPAKLAKELKMHEQKVYYHIKQMTNSGLLEVVDKKEIRGTVAKKLSPKVLNFAFTLSDEWLDINDLIKDQDKNIITFLDPLIKNNLLNLVINIILNDDYNKIYF